MYVIANKLWLRSIRTTTYSSRKQGERTTVFFDDQRRDTELEKSFRMLGSNDRAEKVGGSLLEKRNYARTVSP